MGDECNCLVFEHFLVLPFLRIGMSIDLFNGMSSDPVATSGFSKFADILSTAV